MDGDLKSLIDTVLDHEGPPHLKVFGLYGRDGAAAFEAKGLEEA